MRRIVSRSEVYSIISSLNGDYVAVYISGIGGKAPCFRGQEQARDMMPKLAGAQRVLRHGWGRTWRG